MTELTCCKSADNLELGPPLVGQSESMGVPGGLGIIPADGNLFRTGNLIWYLSLT